MTQQFPESRNNGNGQCQECKSGDLTKETFNTVRPDGISVEILQTTCTYCGNIKQYNLTVVRRAPHRNRTGYEEVLPAITPPGEVRAF